MGLYCLNDEVSKGIDGGRYFSMKNLFEAAEARQ
jgi:hypothetical protein